MNAIFKITIEARFEIHSFEDLGNISSSVEEVMEKMTEYGSANVSSFLLETVKPKPEPKPK